MLQTNIYQLILITDRTSQSYVIFIYECNQITWSGIDPLHARVGISDGTVASYGHAFSGNASVVDIDCISMPNPAVNVALDLRTFGLVQRIPAPPTNATTQMNSSVTTSNVMAQTTGVVVQASMAVTLGKLLC